MQLSDKELEAVRHIRNSIMHKGRSPSMRELMNIMGYQSPRSISLIIDNLMEKKILQRKPDGGLQFIKDLPGDRSRAQTVDVPLVGTISCGTPIFAQENIDTMVAVSTTLARPPHKYFLLRAKGDSMNKKDIDDGNVVLVKQQNTANNGDVVVALIDNEATIKEFHCSGSTIVLKPKSTNKTHKPIILSKDFEIQGKVITSFKL